MSVEQHLLRAMSSTSADISNSTLHHLDYGRRSHTACHGPGGQTFESSESPSSHLPIVFGLVSGPLMNTLHISENAAMFPVDGTSEVGIPIPHPILTVFSDRAPCDRAHCSLYSVPDPRMRPIGGYSQVGRVAEGWGE